VVVNNFYIRRSRGGAGPIETDPPLIVDADAELPSSITGQRIQSIAGQGGKILQDCSRFQPIELQARRPFSYALRQE
jgi:hypothetical protein